MALGIRGVQEVAPPVTVPTLHMVRPLAGFDDLTRFILVGVGQHDPLPDLAVLRDHREVLFELVSLQRTEVRFLVGVPTAFFPDYAFDLDTADCQRLGLDDPRDALAVVIITIADGPGPTTANLLAPVVVNAVNRRAAQVILPGSRWDVRTSIG